MTDGKVGDVRKYHLDEENGEEILIFNWDGKWMG